MNIRQLESELKESYEVQHDMLDNIDELQDELKFVAAEIVRLAQENIKLSEKVKMMETARLVLGRTPMKLITIN